MHTTARAAFSLLCFFAVAPLASAAAEPVATAQATGDYQMAWLRLEKGGVRIAGKHLAALDVPLFIGLRQGKAVAAWFSHPAMAGSRIVWLDRATLTLARPALKGELIGRTNLNWGSKIVHDFVYRIDAAVSGKQVAGTFTASYAGDDGSKAALSGKLTGRLLSASEARKENALPAGKSWPHYYGDGYHLAGPACAAAMVEDLKLARPLWKSEAFIPTAYGSAPDSRYFSRAGLTDSGGGSASPVVAAGRAYQFFCYPRGPVGLARAFLEYTSEDDVKAKARELFPKRQIQQKAVIDHFRTQADEVLVCLDAATGQTLWKTVMPQRGNNYQTHKHRGHFPVPLVSGGVVYQPGTTGRLYALDAVTGKLRWEYPQGNPGPHVTTKGGIDCHAPSPVLVGDVVVFAPATGVVGVVARTGKKKWQQRLATSGSLVAWQGAGQTLIIATDHNYQKKETSAVAIDPAHGKIVWRQPFEFLAGYPFPLLAGDLLVGYSLKREKVKPGQNDGLAVLHAYQVSQKGLKKAWTTPPLAAVIDTVGLAIAGQHVYVCTAGETFCLALATGARVARVKDVGGARTQVAFVADGRLFIQPEGRHGKQSFFMLDADPKHFEVLGGTAKNGKGVSHSIGA